MTRIILLLITSGTVASSLTTPWIGVMAYYSLSVMHPQSLWGWVFQDTRVTEIIAIGTLIGLTVAILRGKVNFSNLKNKQNIFMSILWLSLISSYFLNPYGNEPLTYLSRFNPYQALSIANKIFFFYFVSILLIDDLKKIKYMTSMFLIIVLFYIYWAHDMLFSGQMYTLYGLRLGGPGPAGAGGGIYGDENTFAMLFVCGTPFLFFIGNFFKNKIIRYSLWGCVPLAWHAVFLTGSMGGTISLLITTLLIAVCSKRKWMAIVLPVALILAFFYQGGGYLINKATTHLDITQVPTAQSRFESWETGFKMMLDNPFTGVGVNNFIKAYPDYAATTPYVAHNTLIQFASESGVVAGLMYLLLFANVFLSNMKAVRLTKQEIDPFYFAVSNSLLCSMTGFFICSMFLNVAGYELFYFLLVLNSYQQNQLKTLTDKSNHETLLQ